MAMPVQNGANPDDRRETGAAWGWILLLGVLLAGLGLFALGHLAIATFASILTIGVLMIIGGISHVVFAFRGEGWKRFVLLVLTGALYILAGAMALTNPLLASTFLTLILAVSLLIAGVLRVWFGVRQRGNGGWGWPVATGVVTFLLGLSVASGWPFNSLLSSASCLASIFSSRASATSPSRLLFASSVGHKTTFS